MEEYKDIEDPSNDLIKLSTEIEKMPDAEFKLPNLFKEFDTLIEALKEPLEEGLLNLHLKSILTVLISVSKKIKFFSIPLNYVDCLMDVFNSTAEVPTINNLCGIFSYIIIRDSCLSYNFYDPNFFVDFIEKLFTIDIVSEAEYIFAFIKLLLTHEDDEIRNSSREAFGFDFLFQLKDNEMFIPPSTFFNCISALISEIDDPSETHFVLRELIDIYPKSQKSYKVIHPFLEIINNDKLMEDDFTEELDMFSDIIRDQFEQGKSNQAIDAAVMAIGRLTTVPYFADFSFDKLVEYIGKYKNQDIMENLLWLIDMLSDNVEFLEIFFAGNILCLITTICEELEFKKRRRLAYAFSSIIRLSTPQYFPQILEFKMINELFVVALGSDDDILETAVCDIMTLIPKLSKEECNELFNSISYIITPDILCELTNREYSLEYNQAVATFEECYNTYVKFH